MEPVAPPPPAPQPLRLLLGSTVESLDPGQGSLSAIIDQLFSGLVAPTPDMDVVPDVARRWEVLEGGRKYVFHLRDDVQWSDGTPLTAGDFEYAWKRNLHPTAGSPRADLLYDIKGARLYHHGKAERGAVGVHALDTVTLVVEVERPIGYLPHLLTHSITCPVPRHCVEAYGEEWTAVDRIVTNGPFRLESWEQGEQLVLVRNETYHGRFRGNVEKVVLLVPGDIWGIVDWDAHALALYERDGVDVMRIGEAVAQARERHADEHLSFPMLWTIWLSFDLSQPPFNDLRVRQAFAMAIDRARFQNEVTRGLFTPADGGLLPPAMPGHSPGIGPTYDPVRARCLLAEAGYAEGQGFPRIHGMGGTSQESEFLQAQWQENLGVQVDWQTLDVATAYARASREPPPLFFGAEMPDYPDPNSYMRGFFQLPYIYWRKEAFDGLVEKAGQVTNQEERMKLYQQADRIFVDELPLTPLFYGRLHILVKPWVHKYLLSPAWKAFWQDVILDPH